MADEPLPPTSRKHRVIHWNPDAGVAPARRRLSWWRFLAWTVGGFFGLLFAAGLVIRGIKLVFGPEVFMARASQTPGPEGVRAANPGAAFVSQSKAELSRETAGKALAEVRKLPTDHPRQLEKLILLEKSFLAGEALLASRSFAAALTQFEFLNREIDEFAQSVKARGEAQTAYDTILARIQDLERARSLAPDALEAAFAAAGSGRQFMLEGSFLAAKRTFDRGFAELKRAEDALGAFIESNLTRGQRALVDGQRGEADAAFRATLEKSPGNELALKGLKRAENAGQVHALLQEATQLEAASRYAEAATAYEKAFALDAVNATAQQGKARALRLERETRFSAALATAKAAYAKRDWPVAIAEFEKALAVSPKVEDVKEQLASARAKAHQDAVDSAVAKAFAYENQYQWKEARGAYYEALQLKPEHIEAKEGYARAGRVIRTLLEYYKLIEVAEQKAARAEFQSAIRDFNKAMSLKPEYLPVTERLAELRDLLYQQNQPVEITFKGDGKTWISITNFRLLGQAEETKVKILPGNYEVIGRRKGYQDVLLSLQVRNNGAPAPVVSVVCTLKADKV
jgi:tetratricopeptide (TPR) repeat protein